MNDQQPKPFAKVYERAGQQVLVHLNIDEQGAPGIAVAFPVGEIGIHEVHFSLKPGVDRHLAFAEFGEAEAFALRETMLKHLASARAEGAFDLHLDTEEDEA